MNGVTQRELSFLLLLWGLSDPRIAELREMPRLKTYILTPTSLKSVQWVKCYSKSSIFRPKWRPSWKMAASLNCFWLTAFFERGAHGECSCQVCCLYHHLKDCFTYLPHYLGRSQVIGDNAKHPLIYRVHLKIAFSSESVLCFHFPYAFECAGCIFSRMWVMHQSQVI